VEGVRQRDAKYRPWKGQSFPEKLDVRSSMVSEACIFGFRTPRTFLVGATMWIGGEVQNTGTTPMPSEGPRGPGYYWELVISIRWGDGQVTDLKTPFTQQLQPGGNVRFGPLRPRVLAPGPFRVELTHPSSLVYIGPGGEIPGGNPQMRSGTYDEETRLLHEGTALDKNAIYTRLGVVIAVATLALVILGLLFGRR